MLANLVPTFRVLIPLSAPRADSVERAKRQVLRLLVERLPVLPAAKVEGVTELLMAREAKSSTGVGRGIAIPHARTEAVGRPAVVVGVAPEGIDWCSADGVPVVLFFLILVPVEQSGLYLRILNRLTALARMPAFVAELRRCTDEVSALDVIHDHELRLKLGSAEDEREAPAEPGGQGG